MRGSRMAAGFLLAAVLLCCGCRATPDAQPKADVLHRQGTALIARMQTLSAEQDYWQWIMNSTPEVQEIIGEITSEDWSAPRAVFSVGFPQQAVDALLAQQEGGSPTVADELGRRLFASVPTQLTAMGGSLRLAVSAALTASDCFVVQGLEQPELYLYLYDGDWAAAVFFQPGQDGAVSGSASFCYEPQLREVSTEEQLEAWKADREWLAGAAVERIG